MKTPIKIFSCLLVASVMLTAPARSQTETKQSPSINRLSAGISAGHYRYDPGIAIEFTTRSIFRNHLSLRVRGSVQWLEAYKAAHDKWVTYHTFSAGLVYLGQLFDRTRFYAELGMVGIAPDARFSDRLFIEGIYQFNGLEITLLDKKDYTLCLYFGLGPAFINAHAEKIEGNPGYGNGLHYLNGLRIYF